MNTHGSDAGVAVSLLRSARCGSARRHGSPGPSLPHELHVVHSVYGHDGFLVEADQVGALVTRTSAKSGAALAQRR